MPFAERPFSEPRRGPSPVCSRKRPAHGADAPPIGRKALATKTEFWTFPSLRPAPSPANRGIRRVLPELVGSVTTSVTESAGSFGKLMSSVTVTGELMMKSDPIVIGTLIVWLAGIGTACVVDAVKIATWEIVTVGAEV